MDMDLLLVNLFGIAAFGLLLVGTIFGWVAIAAINKKLGVLCIFFPLLVPLVCLFNYRKTRYASHFLFAGFLCALTAFALFALRFPE